MSNNSTNRSYNQQIKNSFLKRNQNLRGGFSEAAGALLRTVTPAIGEATKSGSRVISTVADSSV